MARYTIDEFEKQYPNDAACLDKVFELRYGSLEKECPNCGTDTVFRRIPTRRSYQCRKCYHQIYPCVGTPFEKSRVPLNRWFYVMYMMTLTRNGVSAMEVQRTLNITYKTALRMVTQIRILMGMDKGTMLNGFVEIDETYYKGKVQHKVANKREAVPVVAAVERLGNVRAKRITAPTKAEILPFIQSNVSKTSKISTDEFNLYANLPKLGYEHGAIKHSMKEYKRDSVTTNTVEGFFSQLKRMIYGSHIHVSQQHLQKYVDEACFRYNHRHKEIDMFGCLLLLISSSEFSE